MHENAFKIIPSYAARIIFAQENTMQNVTFTIIHNNSYESFFRCVEFT